MAESNIKQPSSILIIGVTGRLGYELATASLQASHPTFCLVRPSTFSDKDKAKKVQSLSDSGAVIIEGLSPQPFGWGASRTHHGIPLDYRPFEIGSLHDEESLIEAVKQVNVVICAVNSKQVLDQKPLISVIKKAGCIERFIPSEFGLDPDITDIVSIQENLRSDFNQALRSLQGIKSPYLEMEMSKVHLLLVNIIHLSLILCLESVFMKERDVAAFTISTVDDPRTLNKVLYLRPLGNVYSMNELVEIWEHKIGKQLEKIYVSEEELLKKIKEIPDPDNMEMVFIYAAFVKGFQTCFEVEASGVEGSLLYPNLKYTTISTYLDTLL
ncbi:probable pinoresinol-lariciresinol reductase 3 [Tanacetum coccineum]